MATRSQALPTGLRVHVAEREAAAVALADEIAALLAARRAAGAACVLGLATGATPRGLYAELRRRALACELDCSGVTTVNLDEYLGLSSEDARSFRSEMRRELFEALGLTAERTWFPPVLGAGPELESACGEFETRLVALGGIDLQVLGVGRNGHLAFNEPGSARDSRTREVELAASTRADAAERFGGLAAVPTRAVTLGIATILEARALRVLAFGAHKGAVLARALRAVPDPALPASFLGEHADCRVWVDAPAAAELGV